MTPEQFVYWLQGMLEGAGLEEMTKEQTKQVREHLAKVLTHREPPKLPRSLAELLNPLTVREGLVCGSDPSDRLFC